jgi:hypothetical protein
VTRTNRILLFAATLGIAALATWCATSFELVERTVDSGPTGPARRNPWLAAERLFTRLGVPARTVPASEPLPSPASTIFFFAPRQKFPERRIDDLLAWVSRGGRLVLVPSAASHLGAGGDPLLDRLGLATEEVDEAPEKKLELQASRRSPPFEVTVPGELRLVDRKGGAQADERGRWESGDPRGPVLVRFPRDKGEIVVLASALPLSSAKLAEADNAPFAWELAAGERKPEGIRLVIRDEVPSLFLLLWEGGRLAILSGLLALIALLVRLAAPFGPRLPPPLRGHRSLLEHVEASGELLWRVGARAPLVDSTREAVRRQIALNWPEWARLKGRELALKLSTITKTPGGRIERALEGPAPTDAAAFTETMRTLERIRRSPR